MMCEMVKPDGEELPEGLLCFKILRDNGIETRTQLNRLNLGDFQLMPGMTRSAFIELIDEHYSFDWWKQYSVASGSLNVMGETARP